MPPEEPKPNTDTPVDSSNSLSTAPQPVTAPEPASSESPREASMQSAPIGPTEPTVITPDNSPSTPAATPQLINSQPASAYGAGILAGTTSEPQAPPTIVSGGATSGPITTTPAWPSSQPKKSKKKLGIIAAVVVAVLLLGGGYTFAYYVPNMPSNVYKTGLDHTARAYDKLVGYSKSVGDQHYKSSKLTGTFKFVSGSVASDGTFNATSDDKNANFTVNANIAGQKLAVNSRVITANGQDTPDIYFQVNGVKSFLDNYGLKQFDTLDGQWISVDHTLLESAAANASVASSSTNKLTTPTSAQIQDALAKVGNVNRQYLFKADADHAVLKNEKYLGKSTQGGRAVYGYQVGYDKAHLKSYVKALQSAVNDSSLNSWIKTASGKSASQADLSNLLSSIDKAKGDYTFTMYVDAKTKMVDVLHFKDTTSADYFEIGQGYTGSGNSYPFSFKFVSTSDSKNTGTFLMTAALNTDKNTLDFATTLDLKENGSPITFKLTGTEALTNDKVTVTPPANAKPIMDVYNSLGLGNLFGGSTSSFDSSASGAATNDFTLTQ